MNTKWIMTMAFLGAVVVVSLARGQDSVTSSGGVAVGIPYGYYDDGPIATDAGSGLYGMGAFARGVGEFNLLTAQAIREYEMARRQAIQNHRLYVETRNELKLQNRQFRAKELEPLTPQQVSQVIQWQRPARLTAWQYNPVTGDLDWPVALKGKPFESEREAIEQAFATRTSRDSGADSAFYAQVRRTVEGMQAKLRDRIDLFSPNEFLAAKRFLTGVRYEALSPADVKALAMR